MRKGKSLHSRRRLKERPRKRRSASFGARKTDAAEEAIAPSSMTAWANIDKRGRCWGCSFQRNTPRRSARPGKWPRYGTRLIDLRRLESRAATPRSPIAVGRAEPILEEDCGEVINERFLKMLTKEVEDITQETIAEEKKELEKRLTEVDEAVGDPQAFLQTRMVGLAEVRKNLGRVDSFDDRRVRFPGCRVRSCRAHQSNEERKRRSRQGGTLTSCRPRRSSASRKAGSGRH